MSSGLGLVVGFGIIAQIALAFYVSGKAKSYGRGQLRWLAFTLLFGLIAVIIFLLAVSDETWIEADEPSPE